MKSLWRREMTDLEMTKRCAEKMGYLEFDNPDQRAPKPISPCILVLKMDENATRELYDPLHDDAQCMALVKKFPLQAIDAMRRTYEFPGAAYPADLNRAIVECIAKMKATKA